MHSAMRPRITDIPRVVSTLDGIRWMRAESAICLSISGPLEILQSHRK